MVDGEGLAGRVALITGASRNIGAATARLFAAAGADLVLNARGADALDDVAAGIRRETGRRVVTVPGDIGVSGDVDRLVRTALECFGAVDVVVNNAFGGGRPEPLGVLDHEPELLDEGVRTNMIAPWRIVQGLAPAMLQRGRGVVINVLSTAAFVPIRGRSGYGITKAALWMLTRYMAVELAPHIRVNALCPGTIDEEGVVRIPQWAELLPSVPLGRVGSATELARSMLFLASDASSFTTGQVLFVDGGRVSASGS